jgi:RNA polymerase sigma factor (sigma-70 family)
VVVGQLPAADAPAFRVVGQVPPGQTLRVNYTVSAHDAAGSTATTGTVTLTPANNVATIPAGPATVGRTPDVLTLVVNETPGVRPAQPSATLFLTPPHKVGDAALFEAHKLGRSAEAFDVLLRRHGPAVTRAVQRIVVNRTDAQDVSQFVFVELSKFRGRFNGSLTAWLRTVSRHAALAFLRAKRRRLRHEQRAAKAVAADAPPPAAVDEGLIVALERLPPDQMEAVRLRYLEGYTQQEAAELVGCPRGTLSRRAADGIQALRAILNDGERSAAERH